MKIALIGYGKMGRMIEQIAVGRGHHIIARVSSQNWDDAPLLEADICFEFSRPDSVLLNIQKVARLKKPLIIGTTGWDEQIDQVASLIQAAQIGAVYSPNFSLGMNLFKEVVDFTSSLFNAFSDYDVAGIEYHHRRKLDSPSGSAKEIAKVIEKNMSHVDQVPFSSVRCGSIPGIHSVRFDSPIDSITLTHDAKTREGFAAGAVQAAEWLGDKKGLYTYAQCVKELIKGAVHEKT